MKNLVVIALIGLFSCSVKPHANIDYLQGTWMGEYDGHGIQLVFKRDNMTITYYKTGAVITSKYKIKGGLIISKSARNVYKYTILKLDDYNLKLKPVKLEASIEIFLLTDYKKVE